MLDPREAMKAVQQQRREKLRAITTDLRSTKAKLAAVERQAELDAQKRAQAERAKPVPDKNQQKIADLERHIAALTRAYQELDGAIKRIPPPLAPLQNHSHSVTVDTTPISLQVGRLSEIVSTLMQPRPDKSVRLIHKRNEFGQITETIVEPLSEDDE